MSIDKFFTRSKLKRLLNLPENLRASIFGTNSLNTEEKFILANLYYLDSIGNIGKAKELLPSLTGYSSQKCDLILDELSKKKLIDKRRDNICLRIKPLTYK